MAQVELTSTVENPAFLRDTKPGDFFVLMESKHEGPLDFYGKVFVRLWHDDDVEAYRFALLENPRKTWQGEKDSTVLGWRIRRLNTGERITVTI